MSELFSLIARQDMEKFLEMQTLYHQEMADLTKRKMRQILEQNYKLDTLGELYTGMKKLIDENDQKLKVKMALDHNNGYLWITINPKPEIKFDVFRKKIEKLVNRKLFTRVEYAFEQRGNTEDDIHGWHCHILGLRNLNYKPYKCKQNIKNTVKSLVGNVESDHQVNIQVIGEDFAKDKEQYFKGLKTGEGKDAKQIVDRIWRKKEGLQPFYTVSNQ